MTQWINYHHLYYFMTIAEEGSVSAAAQKLRLGQPTLSAQLKVLEDNLGVILFERKNRRLILSEHGKVALDYAKSIFKMGSEMYEVLNDRVRPLKASLCIGSLDSVPKQITMQLAKAALKSEPCQITLLEGKPDELVIELSAHRIDLLLSNFVPTALQAKGLFHRLISQKQVSIYAAPSFKKLRKNFPSSISEQPLLLPTYDSRMRYDLDRWLQANEIRFDVLVESQDIAVKKLMAVDGLGLLPAAAHTVTSQILSGELIEIGSLSEVKEELYLLSAKRKIQNPVAKSLMKSFKI